MDAKALVGQQVEEHLPKIQKVFKEKVAPTALAAAKDDKTMENIFDTVYQALPLPLRLVIKKNDFVEFCFKHRDKLVETQK